MTTPDVMTKIANHLYQGRDFLRKILEKMQVKMRLHPESIWNEDAEVRSRPMKIRILLVRCSIAAGMKRKGLKELQSVFLGSSCVSFLFLNALERRKRIKQLASPTESPQHCRKGCWKG